MGYSLGLKDLKPVPLIKSLIAEFLGTMFLVIIGCGTASMLNNGQAPAESGDYTTKVSWRPRYREMRLLG